MVQLVGNLALLVIPAALAVLRWPPLGQLGPARRPRAGRGHDIELLQRVLPLGRVVSPLDAVLNAVGAIAAGLLVSACTAGCGPSRTGSRAERVSRSASSRSPSHARARARDARDSQACSTSSASSSRATSPSRPARTRTEGARRSAGS